MICYLILEDELYDEKMWLSDCNIGVMQTRVQDGTCDYYSALVYTRLAQHTARPRISFGPRIKFCFKI
jgi:hypothetical protein